MQTRGYVLVALAACLWATLGLFFRVLHDEYQLSSLRIALLRAGIAAILLLAGMLATRRDLLKVSAGALGRFALLGLAGIAAFYVLYAQAVVTTSMTTGVVLLYTAPAFVTLMAWRWLDEPLTRRKTAALILAFAGCALVARAYDPTQLRLNALGLLLGLGAGLTYALYTILGKWILAQYSQWTALVYALIFGTLFLVPAQVLAPPGPAALAPGAWLLLIGLAIGPTLGALTLYNAALRTVPASNASLVATLEPVIAGALALAFLGERLELWQWIGAGLVVAGAMLVNAAPRRQSGTEHLAGAEPEE